MGNTADDRLADRVRRQRPDRSHGYEGEACSECGNFTLVRNGTCIRCDTCHTSSGCNEGFVSGIRDVDLTGTIRAVTPSGIYGIVELAKPYEGKEHAAINMDTGGLPDLLKRLGGTLVKGEVVRIKRMDLGSEGHRILVVE